MKCGAVLLLLLAACVTAHRHAEQANEGEEGINDDASFLGEMSEKKCKEIIMMARGRFRENKKPLENFVNEYLCSNIGQKKVCHDFFFFFLIFTLKIKRVF